MKNQKAIIEIINEFPPILYTIKAMLDQENVDHILDASDYSEPLSLLTVADPDMLLLNVNLSGKVAIDLVCESMQDSPEINRGMITSNPGAYYISLCSTFGSEYCMNRSLGIGSMFQAVTMQQLN
jgi:two-component SAPR family response regulator